MKEITLAIKSGSPIKSHAFKHAAEKIFPDGNYIAVPMSNEFDVRPLTIEQIRNGAEENARRVGSAMGYDGRNSFAIAIQKGTNLNEPAKEKPCLFCAVAIQSLDTKIQFSVFSDEEVLLPPEMKVLVKEKGMEVYSAYAEVYGDLWKDGKASPYELQTGKQEVDWIRETIEKALKQLKELLAKQN